MAQFSALAEHAAAIASRGLVPTNVKKFSIIAADRLRDLRVVNVK
jgi:hypothetical protein